MARLRTGENARRARKVARTAREQQSYLAKRWAIEDAAVT